jgi:tetratricopeptide (TPR) repeat protein
LTSEGRASNWWDNAISAWIEAKPAEALVSIERFRELKPSNVPSLLVHAEILTELGRYAESGALLKQFGRICRKKKVKLTRYECVAWGNLFKSQGDLLEAEKWWRKLIVIEPKSTEGFIRLGACLANQGRLRESEEVHKKATILRGDQDEAFFNLGLILRAQGRFEEAADAFQAALELDTEYESARSALMDIRKALKLRQTILRKKKRNGRSRSLGD